MAQPAQRSFGWIGLVATFAWACSSDPGPALVEQRTPLNDAAQPSELLGFSLQQVLPAGSHVATLTWDQSRSGIDFSPAAATTELRWSLELPERASELFRIEQVAVDCDRTRVITNTTICDDRLEASLLLHLASDDGALAEQIPVTFGALSRSDISWSNSELDLEQLGGSFSISASAGVPETLRLGVFGELGDDGFRGSLIGDIITERKHEGGAELTQGAVVTVAEWADRSPASSGAAVKAAAPTAQK